MITLRSNLSVSANIYEEPSKNQNSRLEPVTLTNKQGSSINDSPHVVVHLLTLSFYRYILKE